MCCIILNKVWIGNLDFQIENHDWMFLLVYVKVA